MEAGSSRLIGTESQLCVTHQMYRTFTLTALGLSLSLC